MLSREPFLKAIYAASDDDLPRLAFADFLEETGEPRWAELIRLQCELVRSASGQDMPVPAMLERERELFDAVWPGESFEESDYFRTSDARRGILQHESVQVDADVLHDPERFRIEACTNHPYWYGAKRIRIVRGPLTSFTQLQNLLTSPVAERMTELDLSGREEQTAVPGIEAGIALFDVEIIPTITVRQMEALVQMRECRRLTSLHLENNDLDNDAARALANSPHLHRLQHLGFSTGNRFKGRVWQVLLERFGPGVLQ